MTEGKNTLAYLLCVSFELEPSCSPKKGELPKLRTSTPVPLGQWDSMWYALCAEVRKMYSALQDNFGTDFAYGATILHNRGWNGATSTRQPLSAIGLACELEDMWSVLIDQRLITALDHAVRIKEVQAVLASDGQDFSCEDVGELVDSNQDVAKLFEAAGGLLDVNNMTPDDIIKMVWSKHAAEARRRSAKSIEEQSFLAICGAGVKKAGARGRASVEYARVTAPCNCAMDCSCRTHRNLPTGQCPRSCAQSQIASLVNQQQEMREIIHDTYESPGRTLANNMLGAVSNEAAQMQIAAFANPDPWIVRACYATTDAADKLDKEILEMRRNRSNTNNSELAYVPPPRTPSRANKDAYPLGFYGDSSGQRYPPFRPNVQSSAPPVYGASSYSAQVPSRKPVPPPSAPPPAVQNDRGFWQARDQVPTPPESSPLDKPFVHVGPVTYPSIPKSQSQGLFTQSFPAAAVGNPRQADTDTTVSAADYTCLAEEAHDAIRPFSDDPSMHTTVHLPTRPPLITTATAPESIHAHKLRQDIIDKPQPPLPEPDFIAPRPATKQRYVSAGGTAKLHERQEIDGPGFAHTHSGASMPKAELFQKLTDPEFVKQTFGESAAAKMSMERGSQESARSIPQRLSGPVESPRNSREGLIKHDKRERTGSGSSLGSGRFVKLKRVFSRKNSECE